MVIKPLLIHKIAEGKKTQTRRPVKPGEDKPTWKVGRAYAAQPAAGRDATLHFIVTDVRMETLGAITFEDARAEGFKTRDEFWLHWAALSNKPSIAELDFDQPVWVITFRRDDRDRPRLLSARMGRGDYTDDPHQAVRDEPEAITDEQHARLFEHAAAKDDARRRAPLASSMEELQRALDALRERIQDENLQDARLRRAIDSVEHYAGIVQKRLAA